MSNEAGKGAASFDRYYWGHRESSEERPGDPDIYRELDLNFFASKSQRVSGSTKVEELSVGDFHSSGSFHVSGKARTGAFQCSGSASLGADLVSRSVKVSGSLRVHGKGVVADMSISGSAAIEGGLHVRDALQVSGSLNAPGIDSTGRVEVSGRMETGNVRCREFSLSGGGEATTISAGHVTINEWAHKGFGRFFGVRFGPKRRPFRAESITSEGTVALNLCDVKSVKADTVWIGKGCHVGKVVYVTRCDVEEGASLDQPPVKTAGQGIGRSPS